MKSFLSSFSQPSASSASSSAPGVKDFSFACTLAELDAQGTLRVKVAGKSLLLLRKEGTDSIFAIPNRCPHQGYPLHKAPVVEVIDGSLCVTCPSHSMKINVETGSVVGTTAYRTKSLKVQVREGEVWVRV
eukprot:CAMPEP_0184345598 /NCGR_PEP_ID=MMETSP1089-20130417/13980_1 /TAXON_ID=38269 ORGANISM="Gloeochaete wittrockiana, Strain SAG46.84" /NCGR_SAMPLE_ID=MMETSP1089 /ASSEMBLY_ACC=CAM_ASM_000445 /LENGTH=130 /DNA_ID=CAMNT_0026675949 /DNA_START=243 /DNA_END=635 /DNA_ORIENTATION=-